MSSTPAPLYRLNDVARRAEAQRFVGQLVMVSYSGLRQVDDADVVLGELVAVAEPLTGTTSGAGMLVVRHLTGAVYAIGLATVVAIVNPSEGLWDTAVAARAAAGDLDPHFAGVR